jgi:D-alanine-D-alanine ligase
MRVCVLHPSYEQSSSAFKGYDPTSDPARFLPEHEWHHAHLDKATAVREVQRLARQGFDVFVNLCDGAWDEDRAGIEVVQTLERLGQAFTGPASDFYDPSRHSMKLAASYAGVTVPPFAFVDDPKRLGGALELRFPLIVKHPASYSSIGLTPASRVTNVAELEAQVERMVAEYGGALVEEFIDGREATVLVTEPRNTHEEAWALIPFECLLGAPENFKHFDLKWKDYGEIKWQPVDDAALAEKLKDSARRVFSGLRGSGYARCDFRIDAHGDVHFLEINPMCGVFYPEGAYGSADFILAAEPGGHRAFLEHLIACAIARRDRNRPSLTIRHSAGRGFGVHAVRAFAPGEVIDRLEERPQFLVTRRHVERAFTSIQKQWFSEYAFPFSENVFGMWSDRPEDWRPYNHSCDPNAWLDGLDVVARRPIAANEPVTLDYATFCGPDTKPFPCLCLSASCRGTLTGWDHLTAPIDVYGHHVSDYVADARARNRRLGLDVVRRDEEHFVLRSAFARRAGEVLCDVDFRPSKRYRYSLQIDVDEHGEILPTALRLMSHSCAPNLMWDLPNRRAVIIRDIAPGEQFTFFYPSTEWDMAEPFDCWCGAPECVGTIRGAKHLDRTILMRHHLAPHIKTLAGL